MKPHCQELGICSATLIFLAKYIVLPAQTLKLPPKILSQIVFLAEWRLVKQPQIEQPSPREQNHLLPHKKENPSYWQENFCDFTAAVWELPAHAIENIYTIPDQWCRENVLWRGLLCCKICRERKGASQQEGGDLKVARSADEFLLCNNFCSKKAAEHMVQHGL